MQGVSGIAAAVALRAPLVGDAQRTAFRLFNGHLEGDDRFVIDAYGETAVVYHHGEPGDPAPLELIDRLRGDLPWLRAFVVKERRGATEEARRGRVVDPRAGAGPDTSIREHGVRYAVDLLMNQDAGFYLDTHHLRRWLIDTSEGKTVLNTFAYTGSLGVAARAGGAARVVHTDAKARFLDVAKASYALNGFSVDPADFRARDFWSLLRGLRLAGARFDCVILDPPFFSSTRGGRVDLNRGVSALVNKARPLVASGGTLVVVNNSLFVSGAAFMHELEGLCAGGWMTIDAVVGVPEDVTGYRSTRRGHGVADPAPFDHTTKIVVLRVRHRETVRAP